MAAAMGKLWGEVGVQMRSDRAGAAAARGKREDREKDEKGASDAKLLQLRLGTTRGRVTTLGKFTWHQSLGGSVRNLPAQQLPWGGECVLRT